MSFLAKLELDDKTYHVLECEYDFTQNIDETGKPKGMPYGGEISIRVESTGTPELLNWMLDHNQTKDGKIIFYRRDAMSKLQEVLFKKAFCIKYKEHFDAQGTEPLQIEIRLIAQGFDVGGVAHNKMWRG